MFGKGKTRMSANDQFIRAKGKAVGNLKDVKKKSPTEQPSKSSESVKAPILGNMTDRGRTKMGALGKLKRELR